MEGWGRLNCRSRGVKGEGDRLGSFWRFGGGKFFVFLGELVRCLFVGRMEGVGDGKEGGGMKKIFWIVFYSSRKRVIIEM